MEPDAAAPITPEPKEEKQATRLPSDAASEMDRRLSRLEERDDGEQSAISSTLIWMCVGISVAVVAVVAGIAWALNKYRSNANG